LEGCGLSRESLSLQNKLLLKRDTVRCSVNHVRVSMQGKKRFPEEPPKALSSLYISPTTSVDITGGAQQDQI